MIGYSRQYVSLAERPGKGVASAELVRAIDHALGANGALLALRRSAKEDQQARRGRSLSSSAADTDGSPVDPEAFAAVRSALGAYPSLRLEGGNQGNLDEAVRMTTEAHARYQAADYAATADVLPRLVRNIDAIVAECPPALLRRALTVQSEAYVAAAKLLTKVGDGQLAWLAADRAATAAMRAESSGLRAASAYQLSCAFLRLNHLDEAERIALDSAECIRDDGPTELSLRGRCS